MKYSWEYFWGIWKLCATHGYMKNPHSSLDHLDLYIFNDNGVKRIRKRSLWRLKYFH